MHNLKRSRENPTCAALQEYKITLHYITMHRCLSNQIKIKASPHALEITFGACGIMIGGID